MEIIRIPRIMQDTCKKYLLKGRSIGLVPTMGALHEGHLSLVKRARTENDISAVSIFINPTQFGPSEDLDRYPRDVENDIKKLRAQEVDILFLPDNLLMYPKGFVTYVEVTAISGKLCGAFRPGHFRGVATVVAKLLNIASPTRAYFGQKDFQQTVVIRRMAKDLDLDVQIVVCPTIREQDGLAMSSRNLYLDSRQRQAAAAIYKCLSAASEALRSGTASSAETKKIMREMLAGEPLITNIEYASVYDTNTLDEADQMQGEVLLAVAVRMGEVRLIDNTVVNL
ncbi:Pantothenate synthetase [Candidatus Sulfobium mesophilum]|uniref:Pantothenate synthetase n=1 Tax=Candidatus Sulfobium mesophilum TaxID=2016548 RepID=A0A2U3QHN8_9BACT|nr:Pantothenate synthetase [Candidatus Sulfobium mesophilum]